MDSQIDLFEAIYSQRQITRYKPDPVPQGALQQMIDAAVRAPNGGNTQPWEFVVVNDPETVQRLGELYKTTWLDAMGWEPSPTESRVYRHARYLAHHMPEVPAMIVVCADHSRGSGYLAGHSKPVPGRPRPRVGHSHHHRPQSQGGRGSRNPRPSGICRDD